MRQERYIFSCASRERLREIREIRHGAETNAHNFADFARPQAGHNYLRLVIKINCNVANYDSDGGRDRVVRTRVGASRLSVRSPLSFSLSLSDRDVSRSVIAREKLAPATGGRPTRLENYVTIVARHVNKGYLPLIEAKNVRIARAHTHVTRSAETARGALPRDGARAPSPSWIDRRRRRRRVGHVNFYFSIIVAI